MMKNSFLHNTNYTPVVYTTPMHTKKLSFKLFKFWHWRRIKKRLHQLVALEMKKPINTSFSSDNGEPNLSIYLNRVDEIFNEEESLQFSHGGVYLRDENISCLVNFLGVQVCVQLQVFSGKKKIPLVGKVMLIIKLLQKGVGQAHNVNLTYQLS